MKIIPAILPTDIEDFKQKLSDIPEEIELLHLDILDKDIALATDKSLEVHIMADDPRELAKSWTKRGIERIIVHFLSEEILALKENIEIGLGVEMQVPIENIFPLVDKVDFIQLMSIEKIGGQGHPFESEVFDRIKKVREKFPTIPISVDGGVNIENIKALEDAGVDRVVVGSGFKELWSSQKKKS